MYRFEAKRRYWFVSILLIAALSVYGRNIQQILFQQIEPVWISRLVLCCLACVLAIFWRYRENLKISRLVLLSCFMLLGIGGVLVYLRYLAPIEAVHFAVFSWLGWISAAVFGPLYGLLALSSIAIGDEILQYFLPSRVGDFHDVIINFISGCTGLVLHSKWLKD